MIHQRFGNPKESPVSEKQAVHARNSPKDKAQREGFDKNITSIELVGGFEHV